MTTTRSRPRAGLAASPPHAASGPALSTIPAAALRFRKVRRVVPVRSFIQVVLQNALGDPPVPRRLVDEL